MSYNSDAKFIHFPQKTQRLQKKFSNIRANKTKPPFNEGAAAGNTRTIAATLSPSKCSKA